MPGVSLATVCVIAAQVFVAGHGSSPGARSPLSADLPVPFFSAPLAVVAELSIRTPSRGRHMLRFPLRNLSPHLWLQIVVEG